MVKTKNDTLQQCDDFFFTQELLQTTIENFCQMQLAESEQLGEVKKIQRSVMQSFSVTQIKGSFLLDNSQT